MPVPQAHQQGRVRPHFALLLLRGAAGAARLLVLLEHAGVGVEELPAEILEGLLDVLRGEEETRRDETRREERRRGKGGREKEGRTSARAQEVSEECKGTGSERGVQGHRREG